MTPDESPQLDTKSPQDISPSADPEQDPRPILNPSHLALFRAREKSHLHFQKQLQKSTLAILQNAKNPKVAQVAQNPSFGSFQQFGFTRDECTAVALKMNSLVPIRLDLESEGWKLRDTFTWNMNGTI